MQKIPFNKLIRIKGNVPELECISFEYIGIRKCHCLDKYWLRLFIVTAASPDEFHQRNADESKVDIPLMNIHSWESIEVDQLPLYVNDRIYPLYAELINVWMFRSGISERDTFDVSDWDAYCIDSDVHGNRSRENKYDSGLFCSLPLSSWN